MQYDKVEIGNRIFESRSNKQLTQKEICSILGISQSQLSKIESGQSDLPVSILFSLSDILEVPIMWLLAIESNKFTRSEMQDIDKYKKYILAARNNSK